MNRRGNQNHYLIALERKSIMRHTMSGFVPSVIWIVNESWMKLIKSSGEIMHLHRNNVVLLKCVSCARVVRLLYGCDRHLKAHNFREKKRLFARLGFSAITDKLSEQKKNKDKVVIASMQSPAIYGLLGSFGNHIRSDHCNLKTSSTIASALSFSASKRVKTKRNTPQLRTLFSVLWSLIAKSNGQILSSLEINSILV